LSNEKSTYSSVFSLVSDSFCFRTNSLNGQIGLSARWYGHYHGSGFQSDESVQLQVLHILATGEVDNDISPAHAPWSITAQADGSFSATWTVPLDEDEFGATLKLTADGGTSLSHAETTFTDAHTVTSVSPNFGPITGGTTVTITGIGFTGPVGNYTILFGGQVASGIVKSTGGLANTTLTCVTPAHAAGLVNVTVIQVQGTSSASFTLPNSFTYGNSAQTITFGPLANKTYGDAAFGLTASATSGLPVAFSVVSGPATVLGSTVTITGVGTVVISASQAGGGIYNAATSVNQSFTVAKADATVSVVGYTGVYDGAAHGASGTATGVGGASLSGLSLGSSFTNVPGGTATWTFTDVTGNYNNATGTAAIAISKADATIVVTPYSVTYDGVAHTATGTATGVEVMPANLVGLLTVSATTHTNAGTYGTDAWTFAGNSNYNAASGTVSDVIAKRAITITADAKSKIYGSSDPTLTAQVTSGTIVLGETASGALVRVAGETVVGSPYVISKNTYTYGSNYAETFVGANLLIAPKALTIRADNKTKVYGAILPALTVTYSGLAFSQTATATPATASTAATAASIVGTYPITAGSAVDANYAITYVAGTLTVTTATTTTALTLSGSIVRFMDPLTMTAVITPQYNTTPLTGSVEFKIGSHSYGSSPVVPIPGSTTGAVQAMKIPQVTDLPAGYTVTAIFTSTNTNYTGSQNTAPLTVNPRNASPYSADGFYTGTVFAWTTSATTSTATVTLSTTIKDFNSPTGDLRGAKVTFYTYSGGVYTPIPSAQNLPVGLVDVADGSVGTASAIVQLNIGSQNAGSYQIAVGITGAYTNVLGDPLSQALMTVAKPIAGGFVIGGGEVLNTTSNGYVKGAAGLSTDFEVDIQYNNSGTNPKGKVNIFVTSYNKPDGTLDATLHSYVINTNAIALLNVGLPLATGTFSAKANIVEQLSDGTSVSLEGGATFQMEVFQNACTRKIAITLNRKAGGIWFSSSWDGTKTVLQSISSGEVSISGAPRCSTMINALATANRPLSTTMMDAKFESELVLNPEISTNPSQTTYNLTLSVNNFNDGDATVRLYDLNQRLQGNWKLNVQNNKGQMEVDLSKQVSGVYILVVDDATHQQKQTTKIIKLTD
jgi:hypothetical protein